MGPLRLWQHDHLWRVGAVHLARLPLALTLGLTSLARAVGACSAALLLSGAAILPLRKVFAVNDRAEKPQTERGRRQSFREE